MIAFFGRDKELFAMPLKLVWQVVKVSAAIQDPLIFGLAFCNQWIVLAERSQRLVQVDDKAGLEDDLLSSDSLHFVSPYR